LRVHPCRHVAQALARLGELSSAMQMAFNGLAVAASVAVLLSLSDLRGILLPPAAPFPVVPTSPSPDYLWVSLDTRHPECFFVTLESRFWANRRAEVASRNGANGSMRAEIRLRAVGAPGTAEDDGIVWVERRHRFLTREFGPGERVGRYDLSYLKRLNDE
jgi:hypothetical protein